VFRAVVLAEGSGLGVNEFPQIAQAQSLRAHPLSAVQEIEAKIETMPRLDAPDLGAQDHLDHLAPAEAAEAGRSAPQGRRDGRLDGRLALIDSTGDVRPLEEIESEVIRFAITHYRGQMSEVARRLQIGRSTLYRKLDSLGLAAAPEDPGPQPVVGG